MNPASAGAEHDSQNPQQQRDGEGEQAQNKCYEHNRTGIMNQRGFRAGLLLAGMSDSSAAGLP